MVDHIYCGDTLLAIILSRAPFPDGVHFVTPHQFSQQLAFIRHPSGSAIAPHEHLPVSREVRYTQEVLMIRKGRLQVDFYDDRRQVLESRILTEGDVILLAAGGHGFQVLEDVEMIEVKQGPYCRENDKTRFTPRSETDGATDDPRE